MVGSVLNFYRATLWAWVAIWMPTFWRWPVIWGHIASGQIASIEAMCLGEYLSIYTNRHSASTKKYVLFISLDNYISFMYLILIFLISIIIPSISNNLYNYFCFFFLKKNAGLNFSCINDYTEENVEKRYIVFHSSTLHCTFIVQCDPRGHFW